MSMQKNSKIYVAGHTGLVGSAIVKRLRNNGFKNLILKTHTDFDLINQKAVQNFFKKEKPEYIFFCAAKVGGMLAQLEQKADFLYQNLQMQNNVLHFAYKYGVKKLIFIASFCIYPEYTPLPIKESSMMSGFLQPNNEPYGIAKIAGVKMCEYYNTQYGTNFIALAPVSVYGANDNFDLKTSHVQAAIFRKIYLAKLLSEDKKELIVADLGVRSYNEAITFLSKYQIYTTHIQMLGTGIPKREFLHCDDLANAAFFCMQNVNFSEICSFDEAGKCISSHLNVGNGVLFSIKELAFIIKDIVGYQGELIFETNSNKDGTIEKLADISKLTDLGFKTKISLQQGLKMMYEDYLNHNTLMLNSNVTNRLVLGGGDLTLYKFYFFILYSKLPLPTYHSTLRQANNANFIALPQVSGQSK